MSVWQRLRGLFTRTSSASPRLDPESRWTVTIADERISVSSPDGEVRGVAMADLAAVMIETNDSGPWGTDFWWLLLDADRNLACAFPQGATGEQEAMERLMALPGFVHEEMIKASSSTANAFFPVWER